MKTTHLFPTLLACALLAVRAFAVTDVVADWNAELDAAQLSFRQNAGGRTRADEIVRAALVRAMTGIEARGQSGRPVEPAPADVSLDAAAAQAAYSTMTVLYPGRSVALDAQLARSLKEIGDSAPAVAAGRKWGEHVAQVILAEQSDAVALNAGSFAEEAQLSASAPIVPVVHAEQAAIGPGRYRFSVLAGTPGTKGYVDGTGDTVRFDHPGGIAVDTAGNVYVSEQDMCTIRKISPEGVVSTFAGAAGQPGSADGDGSAARFNRPFGLAVDGAGNVYVADMNNSTIRKIDPSGKVITFAGKAGEPGRVNGAWGTARLEFPAYLTVDDVGNVFCTEWRVDGNFNPRIRRVTPDGTVSQPLVTIQQSISVVNGILYTDSWFFSITADHEGNLYVVNSDDFTFVDVVKLTPNAAGNYDGQSLSPPTGNWEGKSADPLGTNWDWVVSGLGVDGDNNLYVKNGFNQIRRYAPAGNVDVHYVGGDFGGYWCDGMVVDKSGKIFSLPYALSARAGAVEVGTFVPNAAGPVIILSPGDREELRGQTTRFKVWATGGSGLTYQWYFNSTPISGATGAEFTVSNVQDGAAGQYQVVVRDNDGSATSPTARLSIREPTTTDSTSGNTTSASGAIGSSPVSSTTGASSASGSSGGGSFDAGISLAVLSLLACAARRRVRA